MRYNVKENHGSDYQAHRSGSFWWQHCYELANSSNSCIFGSYLWSHLHRGLNAYTYLLPTIITSAEIDVVICLLKKIWCLWMGLEA